MAATGASEDETQTLVVDVSQAPAIGIRLGGVAARFAARLPGGKGQRTFRHAPKATCVPEVVPRRASRCLRIGVALLLVAVGVGLAAGPVSSAQPAPRVPVLRVPFPQDDGSLTPYGFELGYPLVTLVYDTLFWRDTEGVAQPWLARSLDTSLDGRRVTVRLADGGRWQDGPPVTADDVAFTFRYFLDHPQARFTPELSDVAAAEATDPSTVVFTLREPSAGFLDQPLADVPILPAHLWRKLPAGAIEPAGLAVGSGPYRLVEHNQGTGYAFQAVDDYFRGRPGVDRIEVPVIDGAEATLNALERREVDMLPATLPAAAAQRVDTLGLKVVNGSSYLGTALAFNVRRPPFDRVEVRRAVAAALDPSRIADAVGNAIPAQQGWAHPESQWAARDTLVHTDEAGARGALAGLALPNIDVLVVDNDPVKAEAARQVALALNRAGVAAAAKQVTSQELSRALGEDGSAPTFTAAITVIPPLASYDPDFLARLFGTAQGARAASLDVAGYHSAAFDALAQRVATTADRPTRQAAVADELRLLATDVPGVPLYFSVGAFAYRPDIYDGWRYIRGSGLFDKRSFVDPKPAAQASAAEVVPKDAGGHLSLLVPVAGAMAAAGLLLAAVLLVRGRAVTP